MHEELVAAGARVAVRPPIGVAVLGVVTLGSYVIVWWYAINREAHELEICDPLVRLLAVTAGIFLSHRRSSRRTSPPSALRC